MRRNITLLLLTIVFVCSLSTGIVYSGWFKRLFGEGYSMGRFLLDNDAFQVRLGDYETKIFVLIDSPLERKEMGVSGKYLYYSANYKFSIQTWKDFVASIERIDERIDEKLKELRPES